MYVHVCRRRMSFSSNSRSIVIDRKAAMLMLNLCDIYCHGRIVLHENLIVRHPTLQRWTRKFTYKANCMQNQLFYRNSYQTTCKVQFSGVARGNGLWPSLYLFILVRGGEFITRNLHQWSAKNSYVSFKANRKKEKTCRAIHNVGYCLIVILAFHVVGNVMYVYMGCLGRVVDFSMFFFVVFFLFQLAYLLCNLSYIHVSHKLSLLYYVSLYFICRFSVKDVRPKWPSL